MPEAGDARTAAERYALYHAAYDARPPGLLAEGTMQGIPQEAASPAARLHAADPAAAPAPASWNPRAVQTCLSAAGIPKTCAPAMFDSGSPNLALAVPGAAPGTWPPGRTLEVGVPEAGWAAAFTSGPGTDITVADAPSSTTGGTLLGLPAFAQGPIRFDLTAGTIGFPGQAPLGRSVVPAAPAPAVAPPHQGEHAAPHPAIPKKPDPKLPFHKTAKKAARLPDTGVPMSAALGVVTAMTALLAGIGTILAARRRTDHEA
jgi:hypothetical protein